MVDPAGVIDRQVVVSEEADVFRGGGAFVVEQLIRYRSIRGATVQPNRASRVMELKVGWWPERRQNSEPLRHDVGVLR